MLSDRFSLMTKCWRTFLLTAVIGMSILKLATAAEPAPGTHRIGYLNPGSGALAPIRLEPLRQGLQALGYLEG